MKDHHVVILIFVVLILLGAVASYDLPDVPAAYADEKGPLLDTELILEDRPTESKPIIIFNRKTETFSLYWIDKNKNAAVRRTYRTRKWSK